MSVRISGSVGSYESGATNNSADVRTVQELLTAVSRQLGSAYDPKGVDGKINRIGSLSGTVTAITNFQRQQVGMSRPDQRIDVNGGTWNKLVAAAGPVLPTPLPPPPSNVGLITLTVTHGGLIPTATKFKVPTSATASGVYESTFTLTGGLTGTFSGSIYPDDMTVKGRVIDGTYPLHIGFHKGGGLAKQEATDLVVRYKDIRAGLLVNKRDGVTVHSDNPNKTTSYGINIHNGSANSRGSDGCLTINPNDWSRFIQLFLTAFPNIEDWHTLGNNTGKKIGSLEIKH